MHWTEYLPALFKGAQITVVLALSSLAVGTLLAFAAGIARFAGGPILSTIAVVYIEIFRGTSLLVQLFWLYYALPLIDHQMGEVWLSRHGAERGELRRCEANAIGGSGLGICHSFQHSLFR